MCDVGVSESGLTSREYIGDYIETTIRDRDIGGEYSALVDSYTGTLAARGDEL